MSPAARRAAAPPPSTRRAAVLARRAIATPSCSPAAPSPRSLACSRLASSPPLRSASALHWKDEERGDVSPFHNLDKSQVLQETKVFNDASFVKNHPKRCCALITKLLYLLTQGQGLGADSAMVRAGGSARARASPPARTASTARLSRPSSPAFFPTPRASRARLRRCSSA